MTFTRNPPVAPVLDQALLIAGVTAAAGGMVHACVAMAPRTLPQMIATPLRLRRPLCLFETRFGVSQLG